MHHDALCSIHRIDCQVDNNLSHIADMCAHSINVEMKSLAHSINPNNNFYHHERTEHRAMVVNASRPPFVAHRSR